MMLTNSLIKLLFRPPSYFDFSLQGKRLSTKEIIWGNMKAVRDAKAGMGINRNSVRFDIICMYVVTNSFIKGLFEL